MVTFLRNNRMAIRTIAVFITACLLAACEGSVKPSPPAAKATEAFGFDFRINPTDEVRERLEAV